MGESRQSEVYTQKLIEMRQAITGLEIALKIDMSVYKSEVEIDLFKNGQIQKFEYTLELTWKFLKFYLYTIKGVDTQTPKDTFREFAKLNYLTYAEAETSLEMIDDRNKIAHEYKDYIMNSIYPKIFNHSKILSKILEFINTRQ
jgi:nucleotidyltransferase substrate binding protein (TIGR01987 family)